MAGDGTTKATGREGLSILAVWVLTCMAIFVGGFALAAFIGWAGEAWGWGAVAVGVWALSVGWSRTR